MGIQQAQLVADVTGGNDERVVEAATQLLTMGVHGDPAGSYLLMGGKAALRLRRISDAAILLLHALRVAEPSTPVWAEILVNRSVACAHHGYYPDAIQAGKQFLDNLAVVPPEKAARWKPNVHHALALCYTRLGDNQLAASHIRLAAEGYTAPADRAKALCDLAWALAVSGDAAAGEEALNEVVQTDLPDGGTFMLHGTKAVVLYHQGRYAEAQAAGDLAETCIPEQNEPSSPLLELRYWRSRIAWEMGNRHLAGCLALHVAMRAESMFNIALRDRANEWLITMMKQGGIQRA